MKTYGSQNSFGFGSDWDNHGSSGSSSGYGGTYMERCYESHPPLPLGDGLVIYGGSCCTPKMKDADIYIGFDYGMQRRRQPWPWEPKLEETGPVEVYFTIRDMGVPSSVKDFKALIKWTTEQIKAGKKVHAGCIGGHGRTGTFFAALVKEMMGEEDAITYVRKNYCVKAVESHEQVVWLEKHFGVKPVPGYKTSGGVHGSHSGKKNSGENKKHSGVGKSLMPDIGSPVSNVKGRKFSPVPSKKSIWGVAIDCKTL